MYLFTYIFFCFYSHWKKYRYHKIVTLTYPKREPTFFFTFHIYFIGPFFSYERRRASTPLLPVARQAAEVCLRLRPVGSWDSPSYVNVSGDVIEEAAVVATFRDCLWSWKHDVGMSRQGTSEFVSCTWQTLYMQLSKCACQRIVDNIKFRFSSCKLDTFLESAIFMNVLWSRLYYSDQNKTGKEEWQLIRETLLDEKEVGFIRSRQIW